MSEKKKNQNRINFTQNKFSPDRYKASPRKSTLFNNNLDNIN